MSPNRAGKKALSHERILQAASRAVRRLGFQGVSVAEVMKDAGLTHGGFYAHFASRDAMLAEAVVHANGEVGAQIRARIRTLVERGRTPFRAFVETYLSDPQSVDDGCPIAALCGEMPRQVGELKASSRRIVDDLLGLVREVLPMDSTAEAAWIVATTLIGAMQFARALDDRALAQSVLAIARAELVARYDKQP